MRKFKPLQQRSIFDFVSNVPTVSGEKVLSEQVSSSRNGRAERESEMTHEKDFKQSDTQNLNMEFHGSFSPELLKQEYPTAKIEGNLQDSSSFKNPVHWEFDEQLAIPEDKIDYYHSKVFKSHKVWAERIPHDRSLERPFGYSMWISNSDELTPSLVQKPADIQTTVSKSSTGGIKSITQRLKKRLCTPKTNPKNQNTIQSLNYQNLFDDPEESLSGQEISDIPSHMPIGSPQNNAIMVSNCESHLEPNTTPLSKYNPTGAKSDPAKRKQPYSSDSSHPAQTEPKKRTYKELLQSLDDALSKRDLNSPNSTTTPDSEDDIRVFDSQFPSCSEKLQHGAEAHKTFRADSKRNSTSHLGVEQAMSHRHMLKDLDSPFECKSTKNSSQPARFRNQGRDPSCISTRKIQRSLSKVPATSSPIEIDANNDVEICLLVDKDVRISAYDTRAKENFDSMRNPDIALSPVRPSCSGSLGSIELFGTGGSDQRDCTEELDVSSDGSTAPFLDLNECKDAQNSIANYFNQFNFEKKARPPKINTSKTNTRQKFFGKKFWASRQKKNR
jgi:hypothetical protein